MDSGNINLVDLKHVIKDVAETQEAHKPSSDAGSVQPRAKVCRKLQSTFLVLLIKPVVGLLYY